MNLLIRWVGATDVGLLRQQNEDAWGARPIGEEGPGVVLVIADGMGGLPGGGVAAHLATEAVLGLAPTLGDGDAPISLLGGLFAKAQDALARAAAADRSLERMGTTLTILLVRGDGAWVGHVGDTRLLWVRGDEACLVTADHNLAWNLVEGGLLSPDDAEKDPSSSILTRHLGPRAPLRPELFDRPLDIRPGDRLLLASDGLGKVIRTEEVARIVSQSTLPGAVRSLVGGTRDGGAPDNVTVVLGEVCEQPLLKGPTMVFEEPRHRWKAPG